MINTILAAIITAAEKVGTAAEKVGTAAVAYTASQCVKHVDDVAGFGVEVTGGIAETGLEALNNIVDSIVFRR